MSDGLTAALAREQARQRTAHRLHYNYVAAHVAAAVKGAVEADPSLHPGAFDATEPLADVIVSAVVAGAALSPFGDLWAREFLWELAGRLKDGTTMIPGPSAEEQATEASR